MSLPLLRKGPTVTACTPGGTNSSSHAMSPPSPSAQGLELFYAHAIHDPRVFSHWSDQSLPQWCLAVSSVTAVCSNDCSALFFPSWGKTDPAWETVTGTFSVLQYSIIFFWQKRWEQRRDMSNICCSCAFPKFKASLSFQLLQPGQHLDAGFKQFSSEQNVLVKNQTLGFTSQVISSSSQSNALQYLWSLEF